MKLIPRNWAAFQHYKGRKPPWIKLHRALLDDRNYQCLPLAGRALAPMLWLLASESMDGVFDASVEELAFRLRTPEDEIQAGLGPLLDAGFFVPAVHAASATLAGCEQVASVALAARLQPDSAMQAACRQLATPETETEKETEKEKEKKTKEPEKKPRKARATSPRREISLAEYLDQCKAEERKAIPQDHAIRAYCEDAGITDEMLQIAWLVFKDRHLNNQKAKKYIDWPMTFANSVKGCWYQLWHVNEEGHADWSKVGVQERRVLEARMAKEQEQEDEHAPA